MLIRNAGRLENSGSSGRFLSNDIHHREHREHRAGDFEAFSVDSVLSVVKRPILASLHVEAGPPAGVVFRSVHPPIHACPFVLFVSFVVNPLHFASLTVAGAVPPRTMRSRSFKAMARPRNRNHPSWVLARSRVQDPVAERDRGRRRDERRAR